jgi:hypothetical protein
MYCTSGECSSWHILMTHLVLDTLDPGLSSSTPAPMITSSNSIPLSLCHFRYSCSCFDLDLQLLPRFSCSCLDLAFLASSTIIYLSSFCCTHTRTCSRQTGKRVVNPRVASSREDRATMANGFFWLASTEMAEFLCLNVWTYHPLGRGREVSFLKADDIGSADTNDQEIEYELPGVNIQRDKTGLVQDLNLYPHKHAMQHHLYFALV